MDNNITIIFDGADKGSWIKSIVNNRNIKPNRDNLEIITEFKGIYNVDEIDPMHIVSLACLRQELKDKGYEICKFSSKSKNIRDFLFDNVNLQKYWLGNSTNYYSE